MPYKEFSTIAEAHAALANTREGGTVYRIWDGNASTYVVVTHDDDIDDACADWCAEGEWGDGRIVVTVYYQSVGIDQHGRSVDGDERGEVGVEVGEYPAEARVEN